MRLHFSSRFEPRFNFPLGFSAAGIKLFWVSKEVARLGERSRRWVGGHGAHLIPMNASKMHLHIEQFSQKTNWKLSEELLHNQTGEKESHGWNEKRHQDGIGTLWRDLWSREGLQRQALALQRPSVCWEVRGAAGLGLWLWGVQTYWPARHQGGQRCANSFHLTALLRLKDMLGGLLLCRVARWWNSRRWTLREDSVKPGGDSPKGLWC